MISARQDFTDPDRLKVSGHDCREVHLNNDQIVRNISMPQLLDEIKDKRILILVHGYNNEQDEVNDAYAVIKSHVEQHLAGEYDIVMGYSWPGGDHRMEWWSSKRRANAVARRFRFLLEDFVQAGVCVDIMSHSLGARLVLKALKQSLMNNLVRNYFCMAAAVDNECFEKGEEFADSVKKMQRCCIFHSKKDAVLAMVYKIAAFDNALGLLGPEDKAYIHNRTKNIFVVNCKKEVKSHGGYKYSKAVYQYMSKVINKKLQRFVSL